MRKNTIILILTLIIGLLLQFSCKQNQSKNDLIFWSKNVKIKRSDFQSAINKNSDANMYYYHGFKLYDENSENPYVKSFFDRRKSWIKSKTTDENFEEEMKLQKIRFDLIESFARKFNQEIKKLKQQNNYSKKNITNIGDSIYNEYRKIERGIYNDYSKNRKELIEYWRPKVDSMLK